MNDPLVKLLRDKTIPPTQQHCDMAAVQILALKALLRQRQELPTEEMPVEPEHYQEPLDK